MSARLLELLDDLDLVAADIGLISQIDVLDTAIIEDEVKDVVVVNLAGLVSGTVAGPIQIGFNEARPFLIGKLNIVEGLQLNVSTAEQKSAIGRRKSRPPCAASGERREGVARPEFPARSVGALMGELWRFFVPGFGRGDSCRHSFRGC